MFTIIPQTRQRPNGALKGNLCGSYYPKNLLSGADATKWCNIMPTATTGLYMIMGYLSGGGTPYISAATYDAVTKKKTTLTVSGAIDAAPGDNGHQSCWHSGNSSWYLLHGDNSTYLKLYPFTLSGTTLTRGTGLDITDQFAANTFNKLVMTSDGTYIYILNTNDGTFKRLAPAGPTWTALTGPTVGTPQSPTNQNTGIFKSGSYIYAVLQGEINTQKKFKRYNIAGGTWGDLNSRIKAPVAQYRDGTESDSWMNNWGMWADPASDSFMFLWIYDAFFLYVPSEDTFYAASYQDLSSPDQGSYGLSRYGSKFLPMDLTNRYGFCTTRNGSTPQTTTFFDISEFLRGEAYDASGSGILDGAFFRDTNASNVVMGDPAAALFVQVDDGTPQIVQLGFNTESIFGQNLNIKYSTKLRASFCYFVNNSKKGVIHYYKTT